MSTTIMNKNIQDVRTLLQNSHRAIEIYAENKHRLTFDDVIGLVQRFNTMLDHVDYTHAKTLAWSQREYERLVEIRRANQGVLPAWTTLYTCLIEQDEGVPDEEQIKSDTWSLNKPVDLALVKKAVVDSVFTLTPQVCDYWTSQQYDNCRIVQIKTVRPLNIFNRTTGCVNFSRGHYEKGIYMTDGDIYEMWFKGIVPEDFEVVKIWTSDEARANEQSEECLYEFVNGNEKSELKSHTGIILPDKEC